MNRRFDVIIVGAGPAGLECARVLQDAGRSVLLLERKSVIGPKPCAGGVVASVEPFDLPDEKANILHHHRIHIGGRVYRFHSKVPIKVLDRMDLGQFQLSRLQGSSSVSIQTGLAVRRVEKGRVVTDRGEYGCRFLVGADGAASVVRRCLKLPSRYSIGMTTDIPEVREHIAIHLDGRLLGTGYIWEFPHRRFTSIGVHYHPPRLDAAGAGRILRSYMRGKGFPVQAKTCRAYPIMVLYRGCRFGDGMFLAGEAAGLVSRLTGEGISFAVISGREIARRILNPRYPMPALKRLVERKRKQDRLFNLFETVPAAARNLCFHLFLKAFSARWVM